MTLDVCLIPGTQGVGVGQSRLHCAVEFHGVDQTFGASKAACKYEATRLFHLIVSVRHQQIEDYTGITDLDSLQWDHFTICLQRMGGPIL